LNTLSNKYKKQQATITHTQHREYSFDILIHLSENVLYHQVASNLALWAGETYHVFSGKKEKGEEHFHLVFMSSA